MNFDEIDEEMDCEPNEEENKAMDELVETLLTKNGPEYIHKLGKKMIARAESDVDAAWIEFELDQARTYGIHQTKGCEICLKKFENAVKEAFSLYSKDQDLFMILCEDCYRKSGGK